MSGFGGVLIENGLPHTVVHREFRLHRAAGTAAPLVHLARAAGRPFSRRSIALARDAVLLPLDRAVLRGMAWLERDDPHRRTGTARETVPR